MISGFAIVPDRTEQPAALFTVLEDAMEWGLWTFGSDAFHIRWFDVVLVAPKEVKRPTGYTAIGLDRGRWPNPRWGAATTRDHVPLLGVTNGTAVA